MKNKIKLAYYDAREYARHHADDIAAYSAMTAVGIFGMVYGYGIGKMLTTHDLRVVSAKARVLEYEKFDVLDVIVSQRNGKQSKFIWKATKQ